MKMPRRSSTSKKGPHHITGCLTVRQLNSDQKLAHGCEHERPHTSFKQVFEPEVSPFQGSYLKPSDILANSAAKHCFDGQCHKCPMCQSRLPLQDEALFSELVALQADSQWEEYWRTCF
eukprot:CAMPEP_0196739414 /NCGR_PEP_ID=MMETSP1091-20130531/22784_1 /TAXON_ID=302021 /ORGANISM="Rhodomonas sp., Strain CCMP768" /LENGTH=118 /DNA_ID=CAMNT_0042083951 /DNA_START=114 /DNA_END=470 /DNA_ORIENTATION=-